MDGGDLFNHLCKLKFCSENLSRHVIVQVANGIKYLHDRGIVHRDIKLENLMFERIPIVPSNPVSGQNINEGKFILGVGGGGIGRVKIGDFGLSKLIWEGGTHTFCGTRAYMAPEMVMMDEYTINVDMWALGCVLYDLLCGRSAFDPYGTDFEGNVTEGKYTFEGLPFGGIGITDQGCCDSLSQSNTKNADNAILSAKDVIKHLLCVNPSVRYFKTSAIRFIYVPAIRRYTVDEFLKHPWCKSIQNL